MTDDSGWTDKGQDGTDTSLIDVERLGRLLRSKRTLLGLNLREVADQLGEVTFSALSRIENGGQPSRDTFIRLCHWLGVDMESLVLLNASTQPGVHELVTTYLQADMTLPRETRDALVTFINMAYNNSSFGR